MSSGQVCLWQILQGGTFEHVDGCREYALIRAERKWLAHGQSDAKRFGADASARGIDRRLRNIVQSRGRSVTSRMDPTP